MQNVPCPTNAIFLQEFIDIYHAHEPLWNVKHPDYNKPKVRAQGYDALVDKMQETQQDATRDDVVKKINSIRCSFRKEYRKVISSLRNGKPYTPRLWYYRNLLFLLDQEAPSKEREYEEGEGGQPEVEEDTRVEIHADLNGTMNMSSEQKHHSPRDGAWGSQEVEEPEDPLADQYHHSEEEDHVTYTRRAIRMESTSTVKRKRPNKMQETHAEIFGKHVAAKLGMVRQDQRVFLEKLINDAIFEAELGSLGRDCRIILN